MKRLFRPAFNLLSQSVGGISRIIHPHSPFTPLRITFLITKKCNLSCAFCSVKESLNTLEKDALSLDEWKKVIDSIPRTSVLDFSGGEVFLAKDIMPLFEHILKKKRLLSIITNGTTINEKQIDFFVDRGLSYFMVSLDGMHDYHDKLRGKKGVFERAEHLLKYLHERRKLKGKTLPLTCVKTVITEDNYEEIPKLLDYAENVLKVDHIHFAISYQNRLQMGYVNFSDFKHPDLSKGNTYQYPTGRKEQVKEVIKYIFDFKKKSKMHIGMAPEMHSLEDYLGFVENPKKYGVKGCNRPWSELYIQYNGQLASCVSYNFGNIRDYNYNMKDVLRGDKAQEYLNFYKKQTPYFPACEGCCRPYHEKMEN